MTKKKLVRLHRYIAQVAFGIEENVLTIRFINEDGECEEIVEVYAPDYARLNFGNHRTDTHKAGSLG